MMRVITRNAVYLARNTTLRAKSTAILAKRVAWQIWITVRVDRLKTVYGDLDL